MFIKHLQTHFFSYIIVVLTILAVSSSYFRFVIQQDYLVSYEGECDPYTESCFLYCEDEECSESFYYSVIERRASEINALCGNDVTQCDAAYECQDTVEICTITYCDPVVDGKKCEALTSVDYDSNETDV